MSHTTVTSIGGNEYEVTIGDVTQVVDLDGFTPISDDDYTAIDTVVDDMDDSFIAPMHSDGDKFFLAALEYVISYTQFDVDEYLEEGAVAA